MIVDFRRNPPSLPPLTIMNSTVTAVESFGFLGTTISQDLKWDSRIDNHLHQLRKFNLAQELLKQFYSAIIESVLCTPITVWFSSATGLLIESLVQPSPISKDCIYPEWEIRAGKIPLDSSHPAHSPFELLPSGWRYRALSTRTKHRNSFFPQAIHLMNIWH